MLAPGPVPHDPHNLGRLDFGVRCVHCAWRVVGMDIVHVGADGLIPQQLATSRDGSRTSIVIRDPAPETIGGVSKRICKGWATPALCLSCGELVGIRGLSRPPTVPLWRFSAKRQPCPSCRAKGVLPFAASPLVPLDVAVLPIAFAITGALVAMRLLASTPVVVGVLLTVVLGLGAGIGGYILALHRWGRGLNAVRAWFGESRCPRCKAAGLAHRRNLGHFGCMAGDDPFGDWPLGRIGSDPEPGWKVCHIGRDGFRYEERFGRRWERLEIGGEMLTGTPQFVIYFDSAAEWKSYPEWARDRRSEIIARVKESCPPPDYAYQGEFEPRGVETIQRLEVVVSRPSGSKIVVEPWGREYDGKQGERWEVAFTGPACGCNAELTVEEDHTRFTAWGWTGCTVKVFRDGQMVDHSQNAVPEIPGHHHPA